jgi:hypothetical protein
MSRWRKVVNRKLATGYWSLHLECGHEAYRSELADPKELPRQVLCHACESLIGSRVKTHMGKQGVIESYARGRFGIAWADDGVTRSTLDELREELEFVS